MKKILGAVIALTFLFSTSAAFAQCTDSDGGVNISIAGSAYTATYGTEDNCVFSSGNINGILNEAVCQNGVPTFVNVTCPAQTPYCNRAVCSSQKPQCIETDGGIDQYTLGTITEPRYANGPQHTDYCEDMSNYNPTQSCSGSNCGIREYYCTDPYITTTWQDIACPSGCSNGACIIQNITQNETCTDSDGGKNYYVKGTATGIENGQIVTSTDGCRYDGITLAEVYCDGPQLKVEQYTCPNSCSDGACIGVPQLGLQNGDFSQGFSSWNEHFEYGHIPSTIKTQIISEEGKESFFDFYRTDSGNDGGRIWMRQEVYLPASEYNDLRISANIRVVWSNLYGDWWPTGEGNYPVHIYVNYKDASGQEQTWSHGFVEHEMTDTHGRTNYEVVPKNQWYSYTSPNLLAISPKPVSITEVMVGGDGWDFRGQIDDISFVTGETAINQTMPIETCMEGDQKTETCKEPASPDYGKTIVTAQCTNGMWSYLPIPGLWCTAETSAVRIGCDQTGCPEDQICSPTLNICVRPASEFNEIKIATITTRLETLSIQLSGLKATMTDIKNY